MIREFPRCPMPLGGFRCTLRMGGTGSRGEIGAIVPTILDVQMLTSTEGSRARVQPVEVGAILTAAGTQRGALKWNTGTRRYGSTNTGIAICCRKRRESVEQTPSSTVAALLLTPLQ